MKLRVSHVALAVLAVLIIAPVVTADTTVATPILAAHAYQQTQTSCYVSSPFTYDCVYTNVTANSAAENLSARDSAVAQCASGADCNFDLFGSGGNYLSLASDQGNATINGDESRGNTIAIVDLATNGHEASYSYVDGDQNLLIA